VLPTLTPDISTFTSAGVYPFYFANGTDNYYELVSDTADFIVNKRMLSVAADTVTMTFGDPLPPLTYRITGFAGTDNESVLDVPPVASTNAARGSLPGVYKIYVAGGQDQNYNFEYTPGTLIVQSKQSMVLPNPSKGPFTVYFSADYIGKQLQIINTYGQRLGVYTINATTMAFNFSNQAPGMYFLKVVDLGANKSYDRIKILIAR